MSDTKKGNITYIILGLLILIGAIAFFFGYDDIFGEGGLTTTPAAQVENITALESESDMPPQPVAQTQEDIESAQNSVIRQTETIKIDSNASISADEVTPLPVRGIGNPDAPIKIVEYSSLTCGHCGAFHTETLPGLKEKYIDSGQLYMEFREYPLNKTALDASKILRCIPEEQYYNFMNLLFQTQSDWAFKGDHVMNLRQNAKLAGMSDQMFDACIEDETLERAIAEGVKLASEKWNIRSTPTFIVNDGERIIVGNQRMSFFDTLIGDLLLLQSAE